MAAEKLEPLLLTQTEAAQLLGLHRTTVHRMIGDGTIRGVSLGEKGAPRVPRSEIDRIVSGRGLEE